jgi:hypothetical protein
MVSTNTSASNGLLPTASQRPLKPIGGLTKPRTLKQKARAFLRWCAKKNGDFPMVADAHAEFDKQVLRVVAALYKSHPRKGHRRGRAASAAALRQKINQGALMGQARPGSSE